MVSFRAKIAITNLPSGIYPGASDAGLRALLRLARLTGLHPPHVP